MLGSKSEHQSNNLFTEFPKYRLPFLETLESFSTNAHTQMLRLSYDLNTENRKKNDLIFEHLPCARKLLNYRNCIRYGVVISRVATSEV